MTCLKCQREIEAESSYCRFCGAAVRNADTARRFVRLPDEGKVAGVCAGLAAYFEADVTLVRLVWVTLSIIPGVFIGGIVAYIAAWLLTPVAGACKWSVMASVLANDRGLGGLGDAGSSLDRESASDFL